MGREVYGKGNISHSTGMIIPSTEDQEVIEAIETVFNEEKDDFNIDIEENYI